MAVQLPNGSIVSIASAYGAADSTATAISNASEAVVSDTTPFANGDIIEVTSAWPRLNNRIARVSGVVAGTSYKLEGIDTSDTTLYGGSGTPFSARKINTFTPLSQVLAITSTGGEQQFTPYAFLEDGFERRLPTNKSARGYTISIADDPSLAHYALLVAADTDRKQRTVRIQLPSGGFIFMNAIVTMNPDPSLTINEVMALEVTLSLTAPVTRYTS